MYGMLKKDIFLILSESIYLSIYLLLFLTYILNKYLAFFYCYY